MTALGSALSAQMFGDKFDVLNEYLGKELVQAVPTIFLKDCVEGHYPQPWKKAEDLPADVVKGIFPSGRPFLAMRYVIQKISKVGYEVFFQRYSLSNPCCAVEVNTTSNASATIKATKLEENEKREAEMYKWNWSSTDVDTFTYAIHTSGGMGKTHFELIKKILEGKPLAETGGRYLPLYASRFNVKKD